MKFFLIFLLLLTNLTIFAQMPSDYYDTADGLSGEALKTALHDIIDGHNSITYTAVWNAFSYTDRDYYYENDSTILDMYSENPSSGDPYNFTYSSDQCGSYGGEGDCYNREHSFPSSWFNDTSPMNTDLFHLIPTDGYVNGQRSNYPLGEVSSPTWTSSNGSKKGTCSYPGYSGTVFEPIDEFKGDFARIYFYMATRYYGEDGSWPGSDMVDGAEPKTWALNMLLEWHANDSVSQKEIDRNDTIYDSYQGNRNPFIDHPEYVGYIWGGETPSDVTIEDQDFSAGLDDWTTYSVASNINWSVVSEVAEINGFGADEANEDWLISPAMDLSGYINQNLTFSSWTQYSDTNMNGLTVKISTNYSGSGSPSVATWWDLSPTLPAQNSQTWTSSGNEDLSGYAQSGVYIAFVYKSTGTGGGTSTYWKVDNIKVTADEAISAPTATSATNITSSGFSVNWDAVTGATGYKLDVASDSGFTSFVSGYNDLDVGNVTTYSVSGVNPETDYYYRIRAYDASNTSSDSNTISVTTSEASSGGGLETFANMPETGSSYSDGTFTGQDGSTWNYVQCRSDVDITGNAIMIGKGRTPQSNFYSGTISGGVGTISFDYMQAFSTNANLNILINDIVVGNVTSTSEENTIKNSGNITVDVSGDFVIKFINVNNGDGQVVVDNVSWTSYSSGTAPAAPVATAASAITTSSFTANWQAASTATSYRLDVATNNTFSNILTGYNDMTVNDVSQSVTGLSAATDYYYRVRAVNSYGTSGNSNTINVSTSIESSEEDEIIITELSDEDAGGYMTAFMEIFNKSLSILNLSNYTIERWQSAEYDNYTFTIPSGTTIQPYKSLIITRGANLNDFETAWDVDLSESGTSFLQGTDNLYFTTGRSYKLNSPAKAVIDVTNAVASDSRETRNIDKTWTTTSSSMGDPGYTIFEEENPLPVTLSSFTASYHRDSARLYWTTQSELNNSHWNVYRSVSGNFGQAQKMNNTGIEGAGTTSNETDYLYEDQSETMAEHTYWYWIESVDYSGNTELFAPVSLSIPAEQESLPEIPLAYGLFANYPNPFNPETQISFALEEEAKVSLTIYNVKGRAIRTLLRGEKKAAEQVIRLSWDGKDESGNAVGSGVYFYRLQAGSKEYIRKMLLIK